MRILLVTCIFIAAHSFAADAVSEKEVVPKARAQQMVDHSHALAAMQVLSQMRSGDTNATASTLDGWIDLAVVNTASRMKKESGRDLQSDLFFLQSVKRYRALNPRVDVAVAADENNDVKQLQVQLAKQATQILSQIKEDSANKILEDTGTSAPDPQD